MQSASASIFQWTSQYGGFSQCARLWASRSPCSVWFGSLSVLPADIRSQVWNIALPQTDHYIQLAPLAKRNWTVLARRQAKRRNRNTLAFARASKRLYDEVMAQFFHKRSLAVVFAVNYPKAPWHRDSARSCTGIHAILVNVERISAMNFANFASIKLLIELPFFNSGFQTTTCSKTPPIIAPLPTTSTSISKTPKHYAQV